jgi:uncharacterized protein YcfJ
MRLRPLLAALALATSTGLSACNTLGDSSTSGLLYGALGGGLVGAAFCAGNSFCIVGWAIAGGLIGRELASSTAPR